MLSENTILSRKYRILEKIGQGGMAEVYKAENMENREIVAIKVLKADLCTDEKSLAKFRKEASSAAALDHENIVNVFDYNSEGDIHYIAMEYINGETLKEHLARKGGSLDSEEIIALTVKIAGALACAHEQGIIHRDIKPQNIMVTSRGQLKVTDFGIARASTSSTLTTQREAIGSVHYMPPEQAKGMAVDARSDLYSLGISMYELATGEVPFDGETPVAIAIQHLNKPLPNPREKNPDLCPGLCDCIYKLTQKDPKDRYQSAEELLADLAILAENPKVRIRYANSDEPEDKITYSTAAVKRKQALAALGIWGTALAAIMLIFLLYNGLCNQIRAKILVIPSLIGKTEEEGRATAKAEGHSFTVEGYSYSDTVEKGGIISQEPAAETETETYQQIRVVLSLGQRELAAVPFLIGMNYTEAFETLNHYGITFSVLLKDDDTAEPGVVYDQYPKAGTQFKEDAARTMIIYIRPVPAVETVSVPGVVGLSRDQAIDVLLENGCGCGRITFEYHETYEKGTVIAQSLKQGFIALPGVEVELTVSNGPATPGLVIKSGGQIILSNLGSTGIEHTLLVNGTFADGTKTEVYYAEHVTEKNFSPDGDFLVINYPDGIVYLEVLLDGAILKTYSMK